MTLAVLEDALATFGGCALIVSHDRWFLDKVATGILAFEGDGRVELYEGSCSDYLARRPTVEPPRPAPVARPAPVVKEPPRRRLGFKERKELEGIEAVIVAAEGGVAELERALQDPGLYAARGAEVPARVAELEAARRRVDGLYARWQELESLREADR